VVRAVVFDLWHTLAAWPDEKSVALGQHWGESLAASPSRIDEVWGESDLYRLRETGPIATAIAALGRRLGVEPDVESILAGRLELTRRALVPVEGAVSTLAELRRRGVATALISNCTEDVVLAWEQSQFAGLFDAEVFSATAGCMKPERRIYELALGELGLDGVDCLFVGDGANDELSGATDVGMTAVLVCPDGDEPLWEGVRDWSGLRVASIPQVLALV
jgi:putative hydrolase of the HAD superfamily